MRLGLYIISLLLLSITAAAAFTIPVNVLRQQKKKINAQFQMRKARLTLWHRLSSSS